MANGRCRVHGGTSTGPRTPDGMARMIAAKTTHGMHGAAGAARRARRVFVRTSITRVRLQTTAIELEAYLPPEMAARLHRIPPELQPPPHLSNQAFLANQAVSPNCATTLGPGALVPPRVRVAERQAARQEAASLAPWKAAIAFARAAKRAARRQPVRARPGKRPGKRPEKRGEPRAATTREMRNNPMLDLLAAFARVGLASAPVSRPAGETTGPAVAIREHQSPPASPRAAAEARPARPQPDPARPLRCVIRNLRNNPPHQTAPAECPSAKPAASPRPVGPALTKALLLGSTTHAGIGAGIEARMSDPSVHAQPNARFAAVALLGWFVPNAMPTRCGVPAGPRNNPPQPVPSAAPCINPM